MNKKNILTVTIILLSAAAAATYFLSPTKSQQGTSVGLLDLLAPDPNTDNNSVDNIKVQPLNELSPYVFLLQENFSTWLPWQATTTTDTLVHSQIYGKLYRQGGNGKPTPTFAQSIRKEGMSWIAELKPNLKWSDGSALTASQIVESWRQGAADLVRAGRKSPFDFFRSQTGDLTIKALGSNSISFSSRSLIEDLTVWLCDPTFSVVHPQFVTKHFLPSSGPFTISWDDEFLEPQSGMPNELKLLPNPKYVDPLKSSWKQVRMFFDAKDTILAGKLANVVFVEARRAESLLRYQNEGRRLYRKSSGRMIGLAMSNRLAKPLRLQLLGELSRMKPSILGNAQTATHQRYQPSTSLIPGTREQGNPQPSEQPIAPQGKTLVVGADSGHRELAANIVRQLKGMGLQARLSDDPITLREKGVRPDKEVPLDLKVVEVAPSSTLPAVYLQQWITIAEQMNHNVSAFHTVLNKLVEARNQQSSESLVEIFHQGVQSAAVVLPLAELASNYVLHPNLAGLRYLRGSGTLDLHYAVIIGDIGHK